eukprot:TRINITY_DN111297_c0_g1_i1.p1 TRINITY_DN111297_c0_g1~~TRINITY_DN111297_c0_g1_i1.p1  ORF type:complete len:179 (-),score=36.43 TRINITY_DN111297_c0_g1_i1:89-625(-)
MADHEIVIQNLAGDAVLGPTKLSAEELSKTTVGETLSRITETRENFAASLAMGDRLLTDSERLQDVCRTDETLTEFVLCWQEEAEPSVIYVFGAGSEACNGRYVRTEEIEKDRRVWKNETTGAWIQWWSTTCGWEMYRGKSGMCEYWTQAESICPTKHPWLVRGGAAPAPTVSRTCQE